MKDKHNCPICKTKMEFKSRYPNEVCSTCSSRTTDKEGVAISFYNTYSLGYGCEGKYVKTGILYASNQCYINGILCTVEEERFGGIVIEVVKE